MRSCGHCIKARHHALLMLGGVLALELLAHRVSNLHGRRWVVGRFTASCALEPLRAASGWAALAMRFGGRAWLAHRRNCCRGCAHRESADGHRQVARSHGVRQMAGYARKEQRAVGSVRWQDARKECSFCSTCSVQERRAADAQGCIIQERQCARCAQVMAVARVFGSHGLGPKDKSAQGFWPKKSLKFEAKRTSFWSASL